ncbi:hypothetical protein A8990_10625 [Paenibacillus taihuensis]|uniref:Uncharacterized protein n=1 Tax=Paenibacillus taihuensis TaxID=1156355 RepID=A0A3D9SKJ8_9BACL|nr:hypothetical protein [Paenibacillus taihuensis]REE90522.1 hypothetical protein A8990_10625 [Paenibacillus taihuensis]
MNLNEYLNHNTLNSSRNPVSQNKINELEKIIQSKNNEILARLASEEELLENYKGFKHEYNRLEAKYVNISKKYELLSKSKLGKLTLLYWKFRKRIPQDF